jgi:hypothetical protein
VITINEARTLLNFTELPPELGDLIPIRGEYYYLGDKKQTEPEPKPEQTEPAAPPENNDPEPPEEGEENGNQA